MQDVMTSMIVPMGCQFAPAYSQFCNGQLLNINQFQALYSLIGTNFGGDGRSSLGMPELRGRSPVGYGTGPGLVGLELGQKIGNQYNSLNLNQLPEHTHNAVLTDPQAAADIAVQSRFNVTSGTGSTNTAEGNFLATAKSGIAAVTSGYATSADTSLNDNAISTAAQLTNLQLSAKVAVSSAGNSAQFSIQSPVQAVNYVIVTDGIYPTRP
jgi:microcystin-dependent protein